MKWLQIKRRKMHIIIREVLFSSLCGKKGINKYPYASPRKRQMVQIKKVQAIFYSPKPKENHTIGINI